MRHTSNLWHVARGSVAATLTMIGLVGVAPADTIEVITSSDSATEYTVNDPDVGDYTVAISGHDGKTNESGIANYGFFFRTRATTGPVSNIWEIAISGLDANEAITNFTMLLTRIAPSVGGGGGWDWDINLSAPLASGGTFTADAELIEDDHGATIDPDLEFAAPAGDSFGSNPTFTVTVVKMQTSSTRALGWQDFSITAVPEPSTFVLMLAGLLGLLGCRRGLG